MSKFNFKMPSIYASDEYISECLQSWFENTANHKVKESIAAIKVMMDAIHLESALINISENLDKKNREDINNKEQCSFRIIYDDLLSQETEAALGFKSFVCDLRLAILAKQVVIFLIGEPLEQEEDGEEVQKAIEICSKKENVEFIRKTFSSVGGIEFYSGFAELKSVINNVYTHVLYYSVLQNIMIKIATEPRMLIFDRNPDKTDIAYCVGQLVLNYKNNKIFILDNIKNKKANWTEK